MKIKHPHLRCNRCGRPLAGRKLYYLVKAQITSEPTVLEISEEDLAKDHEAEIRRLTESMAKRDAQELEDEVYVLLDYYLCVGCKKAYVSEVRRGPAKGRKN